MAVDECAVEYVEEPRACPWGSTKVLKMIKNGKFNILILMLITLTAGLTGIRWGVPSPELNGLYFSGMEVTEEFQVGVNSRPVKMIDEDDPSKLPRSVYNSIRTYHPDEYYIIKSMAVIKPGELDFHPRQFSIGGAYLYPLGALIFLCSKTGLLNLTRDITHYFAHPEDIARIYIFGRLVTLVFGMGIVLLVYLIALDIWKEKKTAFWAGFLTIFSPLFLLNIHFMYVDVPAIFWVMLSLFFSVRYCSKYYRYAPFLMGASAGLAAGSKLTFILSFFIPAFAFLMTVKRDSVRRAVRNVFQSGAGFVLLFVITNPYFLFILKELFFGAGKSNVSFSFEPWFYFQSLTAGMGAALLYFLLAGIIFSLRKDYAAEKLLMLGWVIFFFLMLSSSAGKFARYALPVVPPLIIAGAGFWFNSSPCRKTAEMLKKTAAVLAVIFTFVYGSAYGTLFVRENVRTAAGKWIKENIPAGSSVGVTEVPWQFQMPPFDYAAYDLTVTGYDFDEAAEKKPDYFIISSFQAPVPPYPLRLQKERTDFWEEFRGSGLYGEKKVFRKMPSLLGITFKKDVLPEDLIYLNPAIVIFEKES